VRLKALATRALLPLRLAAYAAFWWLLVVWWVQPESPSDFYRDALLGTLGAGAAAALWRPARRGAAALLRRGRRAIDLVTVNVMLLVAFAECGVRALAAVVDSPLLVAESAAASERVRHHRYPPHGLHNDRRCNSLGLFDEEFELARKPGVRRIVALGDSFAVGVVPYAENFLTRVDAALDAQQETEVLNFGVIGVGPGEYLHLWRTEARYFEPDLVLLCVFIGNDFERVREKSILHLGALHAAVVVRRLWLQRSWNPTGEGRDHALMDPAAPTMAEPVFLDIERRRLEICRVERGRRIEEGYARALARLDELCDELAAAGVRLCAVAIPDQFQVDDALFRRIASGREADFDRELPNRRLAAFLASKGVPFLDLTPAVRAAEQRGPTYKPCDTHWNAAGNAAGAEAIALWLMAIEAGHAAEAKAGGGPRSQPGR
jgi:hypothetical protein